MTKLWHPPTSQEIVGTSRPKHVFIFDWSTVEAVDQETIRATVADLREMGLYRLPYAHDVYVQVIAMPWKPDVRMTFGPLGGRHDDEPDCCIGQVMIDNVRTGKRADMLEGPPDIAIQAEANAYSMQDILIVLLATRNVEKHTKENKLKSLGIGKRSARGRFDYVTTLRVPKELPDDHDNPPTGGAVTPHLRRGHIRKQRHGPGNIQVKKLFIEPIFVNADPEFVHARKAYKF